MKAVLKQIRISPKKANLVAGIIRLKSVEEALEMLQYMPKKAARILYKLLASAQANAVENFQKKADNLTIESIIVTAGPTYKRGQSRSRGRVFKILKRTSHITINLKEKDQVIPEVQEEKKEEKAPVKKVAVKKAPAKKPAAKKTTTKKTTKSEK
ncbi:50S ribosomal protein L22 [Candidatus Peregrinibacteria bacterium]|nr:MAG: 50S ribosomal protein L22 [Candidatus Peregrinibacteria bacterium]